MNDSFVSPIFPLGTPLLPGGWLPLQIFELRYQMMLDDCLANSPAAFGVVLIERGSEVGGGDTRFDIGTLAEIVRVDELPDGRRAVLTRGTERFRVREWLTDDPYPRAEIEPWPDEIDVEIDGGTRSALGEVVDRLVALASERPERARAELALRADETDDDHLFRLANELPLGPADRQRVLGAAGRAERSRHLLDALLDLEAIVRFRRS